MIRNEDYLPIQGWMRSLDLTDKQLLIYALIWSYSRDGLSYWGGTARHLADWAGCTIRNAQKIIRQLEDMGLVGHDVVAWSNGKKGGVRSEFWAVTPDKVAKEARGTRTKINWVGRGRKVTNSSSQAGYVPEFVTPHKGIKSTNIYPSGGGKYTTRSRAKGTTTTTGFLFENNGSGLAAGESLKLPYTEIYFREAWERLLRQPAWAAKTPGALELELQTLADVADAIIAAYCCDLAVKKGWDTIKDPGKVYADDIEQVEAYGEICHAKERRAGQ